MRKTVSIMLMALIILSFASLAYAKGPGDKLVRGVANIFSGWLEIPQTIGEEWKASNNMAVGVVAGAIKGTVHTVCRFASGIWDVFTFPIAVPDNYEPIYSPDYVYQ